MSDILSPIWYPYTQMKTMSAPYEVVASNGLDLYMADQTHVIDAVSSWWCVIHGYNHPALNKAITAQLGKVAHVMLGGLTHEPAIALAKKLGEITPDGLSHVFFSDSGSVAVEVALKMAVQYWHNLGNSHKSKILSFYKAYHGDTAGAMSVCDPEEGMHSSFGPLLQEQMFFQAPDSGYIVDIEKLADWAKRLEDKIRLRHTELAAVIIEPCLQAAGGFNIYAPEYLNVLRILCDRYDLLLIFDEVATGFGRTGKLFAANHAAMCPDIMVLGKALTGGYLGLAATLATETVFHAFYDDDPGKAFMHGPTFMGNPLACAVALESINLFESENYLGKINRIESYLKIHLTAILSDQILDIRILGATGVIEVRSPACLEGLQAFAYSEGVWIRPFGTYAYIMPAYVITDGQLEKIVTVLRTWFMKVCE